MMRSLPVVLALSVCSFAASVAIAHNRSLCTDDVDCYCDCVENTPGTGPDVGQYASAACQTKGVPIDPNVLICEDFENPTYEAPDFVDNDWTTVWGSGTSPCSTSNGVNEGIDPPTEAEGPQHNCRNILQFAGCPLYVANDPDYNESGGHSTLDGTWDGCAALAYAVRSPNPNQGSGGHPHVNSVDNRGGGATGARGLPGAPVRTLSLTYAIKYSSNHHITNPPTENVKGDRMLRETGLFAHVPVDGNWAPEGGSACCRGDNGSPDVDPYPWSTLLKSSRTGGIDGRGQCCSADCYSDDSTRIGIECHTVDGVRSLGPHRDLWNPGVPGGVPMSIEGDKDGVDEWMCFSWALRDITTNNADYIAWVNEVPVLRLDNYKASNDDDGIFDVQWLNQFQEEDRNQTPEDWIEVRDNYHLTASFTPPPCEQIGFDLTPSVPDVSTTSGGSAAGGNF